MFLSENHGLTGKVHLNREILNVSPSSSARLFCCKTLASEGNAANLRAMLQTPRPVPAVERVSSAAGLQGIDGYWFQLAYSEVRVSAFLHGGARFRKGQRWDFSEPPLCPSSSWASLKAPRLCPPHPPP